jgi:hypothetical protein
VKNSLKVRYPNQIDAGKFCEGFQKWNGSSKEEEEEAEGGEKPCISLLEILPFWRSCCSFVFKLNSHIPPNRSMDQASSSASPILDFPGPKRKKSKRLSDFTRNSNEEERRRRRKKYAQIDRSKTEENSDSNLNKKKKKKTTNQSQ